MDPSNASDTPSTIPRRNSEYPNSIKARERTAAPSSAFPEFNVALQALIRSHSNAMRASLATAA
jgi:hypothetical protein